MACWIRGCTTKGGKKDTSRKKSLFTARTEQMFKNWCDSEIAERGINEFSKKSRICELHFENMDILREDIFHMADGATITVQRKVPKLKEDAVPSIFPSSTYRLNPIYEENRKELQNEGTTQLESTINHSVSVLPTCESDVNPIYHEEDCSANKDALDNRYELQTWAAMKRNLHNLTLT
ncbi:uncharacterized protein LOC113563599 [Ooceraea biroi]|uniref:THAP-type domain-containing protein n=1 Tax=Ooceraea biroi TaxID=2015173 RepID=A0A026VXW0_OOCBI|nr:uncharacterized protein LOC113563599 [Ooceraea biroi]EZA48520.1 hypothetical protein X777_13764 [Ooceraea biroi]